MFGINIAYKKILHSYNERKYNCVCYDGSILDSPIKPE